MPVRYDRETRARAVRLVKDHVEGYESEWAAMKAIAARLGMSTETLRKCVRQAEVDAGQAPGVPTESVDPSRWGACGGRANRATDPSVKLFQADPASGLGWPGAWTPAATAQLAASGPIPPGGQTVIGPFSWLAASAGPISLLASASATGDASNADTVNGPIPHRRLIPLERHAPRRPDA